MARLAWHRPNRRRPTRRIAPLTWPSSGWRHGESNPGPPACKLAAESTFAVAELPRDSVGGHCRRLMSGSLPYFSGVRASSSRGLADDRIRAGCPEKSGSSASSMFLVPIQNIEVQAVVRLVEYRKAQLLEGRLQGLRNLESRVIERFPWHRRGGV